MSIQCELAYFKKWILPREESQYRYLWPVQLKHEQNENALLPWLFPTGLSEAVV